MQYLFRIFIYSYVEFILHISSRDQGTIHNFSSSPYYPLNSPLMKLKKIMIDAKLSFFNKLHSGNLKLKLPRPSPIP